MSAPMTLVDAARAGPDQGENRLPFHSLLPDKARSGMGSRPAHGAPRRELSGKNSLKTLSECWVPRPPRYNIRPSANGWRHEHWQIVCKATGPCRHPENRSFFFSRDVTPRPKGKLDKKRERKTFDKTARCAKMAKPWWGTELERNTLSVYPPIG